MLTRPDTQTTKIRLVRWFAACLRPHWGRLCIGIAASVVATGAQLASPWLIMHLVDDVITGGRTQLLGRYIALMLAAAVASAVFTGIRGNVMHILGQRLILDLRCRAYRHLVRLSLSYFERNRVGDIVSRLSNDVDAVEAVVAHGTDNAVTDGLYAIVAATLMCRLHWGLAILSLAPLPLLAGSMLLFAHWIRPIYRKIRDDLGRINAMLAERISGIRVVKAFGREEHELEALRRAAEGYYRSYARTVWMWSAYNPLLTLVMASGTAIVLWRGTALVASGHLTTGALVAFMAYVAGFLSHSRQLAQVYDTYNKSRTSLNRVFELMEERPAVADVPDACDLGDVRGDVELRGVWFRYATGDVVLKDLSVHAAPGETVALVGRSGAGKTSVLNLIARFYDPTDGLVTVDGHDIAAVAHASLRRNIAVVLQEALLFSTTVKENVRYGRLDATDDEIIDACRAAHADEFIERMPDRYESYVGAHGVKLSGGQQQRLAIARALVANPRILLLDEATSMVDVETEQHIQKALETLTRGRTVFVIAHRLSTIRDADKIVVVDDGEAVEQGDHTGLMQQDGLYASMYKRQFGLDPLGPIGNPPAEELM